MPVRRATFNVAIPSIDQQSNMACGTKVGVPANSNVTQLELELDLL